MLLREWVEFKSPLVEVKDRPGIYECSGVLQRAGAKNQNGRVYSKLILEREAERYAEQFINVGIAYGELDHPDSTVVEFKNASHIIKEIWWEGDDLCGRIELLNTPSGNIVKEIMKAGHTVGISSRGTGSVSQTNEGFLEVEDDFELICWDFVTNPSTQGAFITPVNNKLQESIQKTNEVDRIDYLIRELLCLTANKCEIR